MQEVEQWLAKLGMSEYAERFAANRIDFTVLPDLTDEDLKDIGVVLGDRRKILRAIARLDAAPEAVVLDTKPPSTLSVAAVQGLLIEAESHERRDVTLDEIVGDAGGGHLRANYHRLIARAVKGLESTAEARQVIYERARKAMIAHLRFNQPGVSKAVIVKERFALEAAIRKIEAEAAGKSRTPTEPQPAIHGDASEPPQRDDADSAPADMPEGGWSAVLLDAREQLWSGWSSLEKQAVKGFRDVVREVHAFDAETAPAAQTTPQSREPCEEEAAGEPVLNPQDLNWPEFDVRRERHFEHAHGPEDDQRTALPQVRATRGTARKGERTRRSLS